MYPNNNHKLIGVIYIITSIIIGLITYLTSNIIRLELTNINNVIISLVNISYYNINKFCFLNGLVYSVGSILPTMKYNNIRIYKWIKWNAW